jgi:NAD(P) transhydrogenase subunit alpha
MNIAVPRESVPGERRVALSPEGAKLLVSLGANVVIEKDAGYGSNYSNSSYEAAGARVIEGRRETLSMANAVLQINFDEFVSEMPDGSALICFVYPLTNLNAIRELVRKNISCFAMELVPRISRAQSMDALSSMSTIAGYRAVLAAAARIPKFFPMLMTAAGSIAPAKVLVIGAGVAGLQAIATARRLGGIVEAFDVRPAVKEQVLSLGARYVDLGLTTEEAEDSGGYAKEVTGDTHSRELKVIGERVPKSDVVITTALILGRPAPVLITEEMVRGMARGSVIVDLAAVNGGNCELTKPGEVVDYHGVLINGSLDFASAMSVHASQMYSKNVTALMALMIKDGALHFDFDDEILRGCVVTHGGKVMHDPTRLAMERGT